VKASDPNNKRKPLEKTMATDVTKTSILTPSWMNIKVKDNDKKETLKAVI
jgi:hypothetical protein